MAATILSGGLDGRELRLEVRFLQRRPELLRELTEADELVREAAREPVRLIVIGGEIATPELIGRLRASPGGRRLSLLAVLGPGEHAGLEGRLLQAGANAALRRPLDRFVLESWIGKLLAVPQRVLARVPVHVQVVGSRRGIAGEHFYGLSRNLSVHGMLLASPIRIEAEDVDLELDLPEPEGRVRVLGRVAREAVEVGWPYFGYGVEFLFLPEAGQRAIQRMVLRETLADPVRTLWAPGAIHSTLRRGEWIYEITEPARTDQGFLVEIRRAERQAWRPGQASPFHILQAAEPRAALEAACAFVRRHG